MKTVRCTIDGGISFNPGGEAYGSFQVEGDSEIHRRTFGRGRGHTNNTAEVETALAALEWIAEHLAAHCFDAARTHVVFLCDSQLCCTWINRGRNPRSGQIVRLVDLLERFRRQARAFASVSLQWQPRELSVAVLGH